MVKEHKRNITTTTRQRMREKERENEDSDDNEYEEGDGIRDTIEFDNRIRKDLERFDTYSLSRLDKHLQDAMRRNKKRSLLLFLGRCEREKKSIRDVIELIDNEYRD